MGKKSKKAQANKNKGASPASVPASGKPTITAPSVASIPAPRRPQTAFPRGADNASPLSAASGPRQTWADRIKEQRHQNHLIRKHNLKDIQSLRFHTDTKALSGTSLDYALPRCDLVAGSHVLGAVQAFDDHRIFVDLPGNAKGVLPITNVSAVLTTLLKIAAGMKALGSTDAITVPSHLDADYVRPRNLFYLNQWLHCVVLNHETVEDGDQTHQVYELSVDPELANRHLTPEDLMSSSMVVSGTVRAQSGDGYVVDLGSDHLMGFISLEAAQQGMLDHATSEQPLAIGQYLLFETSGQPASDGLTQLSVVHEGAFGSPTDHLSSTAAILPGMLVSATITAVATRGLECRIMDSVKATIHWYHADGVELSHSSAMLTKYHKGQIIQARVLATDDAATDRPLALTNRWHMVNMANSAISTATGLSPDYSGPIRLGSQIPISVTRASAKMGLVGSVVDLDGVVAVAPPNHWQDNPAGIPETNLADFLPGQWVTTRVLKYSPCENTITVSARPADLARKYWQLSDVSYGQRISGVISEVQSEAVRVEIAPEIFGFLPLANIPKDSPLTKRSQRKVGKPVDAIVWSADGVSDPMLTCHTGLLETALRLDYSDDQYGVEFLTCAIVTKVRRGNVHVEFPGGQCGVIKADNVAQAQATDPSLKPAVGQAIRCYRAGPSSESAVAVKLICQTAVVPTKPSTETADTHEATDTHKGAAADAATMALDAKDDEGKDVNETDDGDYEWVPSPLTVHPSEPRPHVSTSKVIEPATLRRGIVVQKTAHTIIVQLYPTNVRAELPRAHLSDHLGPIVDALFSRVQIGDQVDQCVVVRPYEPVLISRKPLFLTIVKSGLNLLREPQAMTDGQLVPGFVTGLGKSARIEFLSGVHTSIHVGQLADYFVGEPKQHLSQHQTVLAALQNDEKKSGRPEFTLKTSKTIEPLLMAEQDEKGFHYPVARLNLMGLFAASFFSELDVLPDAALSTQCLGQYVSGKVIQELPNGLIVDLKDDFCGFVAKEHLENPKPKRGDNVVGRILDFNRSKNMADLTLLSETMVHREARKAPVSIKQLLQSDTQSPSNEFLAPVLTALQAARNQRQEIEARVQLVKDNYLVLTIPTMNHAVMFAMATSYNDHRRPAFKYAVGDSYAAVLCQVPSSTTASNLRIVGRVRPYLLHEAPDAVPRKFPDSATQSLDATPAPTRLNALEAPEALRHSPADITPGAIVDVQITRISRTSMHVRLADNTVGVITPLDVVDTIGQLKDPQKPFAQYSVGQIIDAKVVQSETGAALPFLNMRPDQTIHILSLRPGELNPTTVGRVVYRPPTLQQLVIGQTYLGFVIATRNRVLTVTLPGGVKGHSGGFHLSCKPQVLESVDSHFTVGGVVSCRLVGLAGELAQVVIMSGEYPGIDMPKQMEPVAPEPATLCIMGTCTLGYMARFPDAQSQCGYILWTEVADDYDQLVQQPLQLNQEVQGVVYARITHPMNAVLVSLRASRRAIVDSSARHPVEPTQTGFNAVPDPVIAAIKDLKRGQIVRGFVRTWVPTGVIVCLGPLVDAFCPMRQLSHIPLALKSQAFRTGQLVTGMVNKVPRDNRSPVITLDRTRFDPTYHVFNREHFHVSYASMGRVMAVSPNAVAINLKYSDVIGICFLDEMADEAPEAVRQRLLPGDSTVVRVIANDDDDDRLKLTMRASAFTKQEAVTLTQEVDNDDMYYAWFKHCYGAKAIDDTVAGDEENVNVGAPTVAPETRASPAPGANNHDEPLENHFAMGTDMDEDHDPLDSESQFESEDDDDDDASSIALSDTGSVQQPTRSRRHDMDFDSDDDDGADDLPEVTPPTVTGVNVLNALPAKRGFDWDDSEPAATEGNNGDDDSDADQAARTVDDEHLAQAKKRRKKDKDDRLVLVEDITGDLDEKAPAVASDFERLLVGSPDSSYLWINYMAFHLKLAQVEKARAIGERALKTINFREEQEKFNMWVAMFNLENQFGSRSELDALVTRALRVNSPKKIYIQLAMIYDRSNKTRLAEKTHLTLLKKFSGSCKAWTLCGAFYLRHRMATKAHELLQRCIQVLPKRKHLKAISRFGIMEFKEGDPERGRTIFEGIISNHPKRLDLWSVFIDMETKTQHLTNVRMLFQRALALNLSTKKTKFFFKKWLAFEKKFGSTQDVEAVKQRALEYVQSVVQN